METSAMKIALLLFCVLFASLTWGQTAGVSVLSGQPQPLHLASNPQHATQASMSQQQNLLGVGSYSYAKGETPLWEVAPPPDTTPLGDIARKLKKERETAKKATFVREN